MSRRRSLSLKTVLFLFLVTFVWLQLLNILNLSSNNPDSSMELNDSIAVIMSMVPPELHKFLTAGLNNGTMGKSMENEETLNISDILRNIGHYNEVQQVYNEEIFGPIQNDTIIIVVQVHLRVIYLRHLIISLAQVRDISTALLIFSHDVYNDEINELIQSVDFCKVMQIFYPYSIQTHPHKYPGKDPNDCPRNIIKEHALIRNCNNALYPDRYGHYREAKFTQTKHHWWWKANIVFNQLEITRDYSGMVVFLEEDHFVAEDFLYVLKLMEKTGKYKCPKCNILCLGTYSKTYNYYKDSKKIEITPWVSSKHNMGMALNRSTWLEIKKCAEFFCKYDDYNWDWSLQHISQTCLPHKLHAIVVKGPRVFHIGECGVHHKKINCASRAIILKVHQVLKGASRYLFPSYVTLTFTMNNKKYKSRKGNGGWGDHRDHNLCINVSLTTTR